MKANWNPTKSIIEEESIDLATKWVLMVSGITSIAAGVVSYVYPQSYPVELVLVAIGVSLISKSQGRGKYLQMPWKTYCWIYALITASSSGYVLVMRDAIIPKLSAAQLISLPLSLLCVVAIYGFVYKKNMFAKKFWKAMFIIYLTTITWDYIQKTLSAESLSLEHIGLIYLIFLLFIPSFYAFGMYAFKPPVDVESQSVFSTP